MINNTRGTINNAYGKLLIDSYTLRERAFYNVEGILYPGAYFAHDFVNGLWDCGVVFYSV